MSRFRAVEFGVPVLVAATSGISAVVAADGSLTTSLADGTSGVLRADVAVSGGETLASRIGSHVEVALVAVAIMAVIAGMCAPLRRPKRRA
jgi:apolipoprotein N-acyltransferase